MYTKTTAELENISTLRNSPMLSGLNENDFLEILPEFRYESWAKGSFVMPPESTQNRFYILLSGRVRIEGINQNTGRSLTLYLLKKGDGHNLISLLDGKRHEVLADTLDKVEAMSAPLTDWRNWLNTYPSVRLAALRNAGRLLRDLAELAEDLALHDTSARLAHQVLRHLDQDSGELKLIGDLIHEDLAHLIGSVRVVVTRLINHFKREGIINTEAGSIKVANLERLLQKAERRIKKH